MAEDFCCDEFEKEAGRAVMRTNWGWGIDVDPFNYAAIIRFCPWCGAAVNQATPDTTSAGEGETG